MKGSSSHFIILLFAATSLEAADSLNVHLLAGIPAGPYSVAADTSGIVVVGGYSGISVYRLSSSPLLTNVSNLFLQKGINGVALSGNLGYATTDRGLLSFSLSDPYAPSVLQEIDLSYSYFLDVKGNVAYVCSDSGLISVDISDPTNMSALGVFPRACYDVVVRDTLAYVSTSDSLLVINVSDPTSPYEIGSVYTYDYAEGLDVKDTLVYVASYSILAIINVSDPTDPTFLSYSYTDYDYVVSVVVMGDYAWCGVADDYYGVEVFNVSDPTSPYVEGFVETPDEVWDVDKIRNYVLAPASEGVAIFDTASVDSPYVAFFFPDVNSSSGPTGVSKGAYAFLPASENVLVADTRDSTHFFMSNVIYTDGTPGQYLMLRDSLLYVVSDVGRLFIFNVADPDAPVLLGSLDTAFYYMKGVTLTGNYVVMVRGTRGLNVVDVSDPSSPLLRGSATGGYMRHVCALWPYLYVLATRLYVYDLTDPDNPALVDSVSFPNSPTKCAVAGSHLFLTAPDLYSLDLSDPSSPAVVGSLSVSWSASAMEASGDTLLYVNTTSDGLRVLDVSSPTAPHEVGYYVPYSRDNFGRFVVPIGENVLIGGIYGTLLLHPDLVLTAKGERKVVSKTGYLTSSRGRLTLSGEGRFSIYDVSGRIRAGGTLHGSKTVELPPGTYMVKMGRRTEVVVVH